ncbi:unnamed protein product [Pleuronectes platessa]|uniref:Uncharacterized protein n=1 Tax=Pleuronectes platessa TaxID=8262 RepID=A0A9N7YFJ7_PLEPL|nr:unnamed protein product [Pleuronectes platessa]
MSESVSLDMFWIFSCSLLPEDEDYNLPFIVFGNLKPLWQLHFLLVLEVNTVQRKLSD